MRWERRRRASKAHPGPYKGLQDHSPRRSHMSKASIVVAGALFLVASAAFAQAPNDAQIAHIVVTANAVDIDAGKLAESKSANADVKAFGQRMVTDHSGVNKSATELVTKLKVTPQDNPTSQALNKGGEENL